MTSRLITKRANALLREAAEFYVNNYAAKHDIGHGERLQKVLNTPELAKGKCYDVAADFSRWANSNYPGPRYQVISGEMPESTTEAPAFHFAVRAGNLVVDLTGKQFDLNAPIINILPLKEWRKKYPTELKISKEAASSPGWTRAEEIRVGDTLAMPGTFLTVTNVHPELDEIVVQGKPGQFRRFDPKDEVNIYNRKYGWIIGPAVDDFGNRVHVYLWIYSENILLVSDKFKYHTDLAENEGMYDDVLYGDDESEEHDTLRGMVILYPDKKTGDVLMYAGGSHHDASFIPNSLWRELEQEFKGYKLEEKSGLREAISRREQSRLPNPTPMFAKQAWDPTLTIKDILGEYDKYAFVNWARRWGAARNQVLPEGLMSLNFDTLDKKMFVKLCIKYASQILSGTEPYEMPAVLSLQMFASLDIPYPIALIEKFDWTRACFVFSDWLRDEENEEFEPGCKQALIGIIKSQWPWPKPVEYLATNPDDAIEKAALIQILDFWEEIWGSDVRTWWQGLTLEQAKLIVRNLGRAAENDLFGWWTRDEFAQFVREFGHPQGDSKTASSAHSYGCIMAEIPDDSQAAIMANTLRDQIDQADLAGDGKDIGHNHITLRYGFIETNPVWKQYLSMLPPIEATFKPTIIFEPSKSSDGAAVVVAPCESSDLQAIHQKLGSIGQWKKSDFEYQPHITIAYVKPEVAKKYEGKSITGPVDFVINRVEIRDKDDNAEWVELKGGSPKVASGTVEGLGSLLKKLRPELAKLAQKQYDEWDASDETYGDPEVGFGGICHLIVDEWADLLAGMGYNTSSFSHSDQVHVSLTVWEDPPESEEGNVEVWDVDLNPFLYEHGGGYTWTKIPGVTIQPEDIVFYRQFVSREDLEAIESGF